MPFTIEEENEILTVLKEKLNADIQLRIAERHQKADAKMKKFQEEEVKKNAEVRSRTANFLFTHFQGFDSEEKEIL